MTRLPHPSTRTLSRTGSSVMVAVVLLGCGHDDASPGYAAFREAPVTDSVVTAITADGLASRLRLVTEYSGTTTGFGRITAAAVTHNGTLYLFDASPKGGESGLFRIAPGASLPEPLLRRGSGPGEIATRRAVLVPRSDGGLLVADPERFQMLLLDTLGAVVFDLRGQEFRSNGYWPGRNGGVWFRRVTQQLGQRADTIVHLSRDGQLEGAIATPRWATEPFGRAEFIPRLSVTVDTSGSFAAAWTDEMRVVYAHNSGATAWTSSCSKSAMEPEQFRIFTQGLDWELRHSTGPTIRPVASPLKPCLSGLLGFDATGTLWVLMYGRSRALPAAADRFADRLPAEIGRYAWEEVERIGRFGADGRFLGWVDLAEGDRFLEGVGDRLWVVNEESDAGSVVREYRVE